eukprot:jgi/Chrzof1/9617/Cz04g09250.t1
MEGTRWPMPVAKLTNVTQNDLSPHLSFPTPLQPTCVCSTWRLAADGSTAISYDTLQAVDAILSRVDTRHLRPRGPPTQLHTQPGDLTHALLGLNPAALDVCTPNVAASAVVSNPPAAPDVQLAPIAVPMAQPSSAPTSRQQSLADKQERKRRRRTTATDEAFVAQTVDKEQIAAQAAIAVSDFLLKVKDIQTRQQVNGDQNYGTHVQPMEDDMDDDDALEQDKQPYIPLPMFRSLCDNLSVARTAGVLNRLDMADLKELLCLLHSQVRVGLHKPIPDSHDDANSGPYLSSVTALDAAVACLQVLASPGMPSELYLEELLNKIIELTRYQLQYNIMVFHSIKHRQLYRPSSMQGKWLC